MKKAALAIPQRYRKLMNSHYISILAIIVGGLLNTANYATAMVDIQVSPNQSKFAMGEPAVIDVIMTNNQSDTQRIKVNGDWKDTLAITLKHNGSDVPRIKRMTHSGGISSVMFEQINPGKKIDVSIVLNELFSIRDRGDYTVDVSVIANDAENTAKTSFSITSADFEKLHTKYRAVLKEYLESDTSLARKRHLARVICLSDNPSALDAQKEMFERRQQLSIGDLSCLTNAMVKTHNSDVIDFMLKQIATNKSDRNARKIFFNAIRVEGLNNFDEHTKSSLKPYLREIQDSAPLDISD